MIKNLERVEDQQTWILQNTYMPTLKLEAWVCSFQPSAGHFESLLLHQLAPFTAQMNALKLGGWNLLPSIACKREKINAWACD